MNSPSRSFGHSRHNPKPPFSRTNIVIWLRKTHGWIGLWGATLGLLFGVSGIWLNHRSVLQLQQAQERSNFQLPLPDPGPVDAQTMAAWLQLTLSLPQQATNVRVEPARPVAWTEGPAGAQAGRRGERHEDPATGQGARGGDAERTRSREREVDPQALPRPTADAANPVGAAAGAAPETASAPVAAASGAAAPLAATLMQPEHWMITFGAPKFTVQAEYWGGNHTVGIRRVDNGFIATLTSLHKGIGMPVGWILLVDTLAGSLILLSLSGLALWMLTHRNRTVGLAIFSGALAVTAGLALAHL